MAPPAPFILRAGSRLHFGLWAWGPGYERQFGGAGMMIDWPRLEMNIEAHEMFEVTGHAADRAGRAAMACTNYFGWPRLPACRLKIDSTVPQHIGLGVGTQLDLLVAKGLAIWQGRGDATLAELVMAVDRRGRSSVGSYGFAHGGLVVEAGRRPGETLGELLHQVAIPDEWRILLILPKGKQGLSGTAEREAFESLPSVPEEIHQELKRLACHELVPAAQENEFARFASALYEYGNLAGRCYQPLQATPYFSPDAARLVETLRNAGIAGVAQSSWGPTLFALLPNDCEAQHLALKLQERLAGSETQVVRARGLNQSVQVILRNEITPG